MRIEHVVFDIGGVLLNWHNALKVTAHACDVDPEKFHDLLKKYIVEIELGNTTDDIFWENVIREFGPKLTTEQLKKIWVKGHSRMEDAWELAKTLKNNGMPLAAFTNNWIGLLDHLAVYNPDLSYFTYTFDSSKEKVRKPDPRAYEIVIQNIGISPENVLFIDDLEENIEAAKKAGWNTVHYAGNLKEKCGEVLALIGI